MLRYCAHRLGFMLLSLAGVITLCFFLIHLVPGDPVDTLLGEQAALEDKNNLRRELGLDQPLSTQFVHYLSGLAQFDLGRSLRTRYPVMQEITDHFPATFQLALTAMVIAVVWGLPLGVWAAVRAGRAWDHFANAISLLGMSVPGVFLGPALIYIFAIRLDWFPVSDRGGLEHVVLPALSLALPLGAVIVKMTRAAMLEILRDDYMRTARAKGVSEFRLYFRHGLRNAMIPITTIIGIQLGALLTGTVITETIFDWPGVGMLLFGSIQSRDYPLVQGCVLFVACIYVFVNLLTDLTYGVVNPRVRLAE
ncbi:MAG: ABC transporter permease [Bdellovibrionales bacterium]|nr:ABC transporter permease [Bdellovibrionales bacterium]